MRNRAKCKLCQEVLESFHRHDFVTCKCGEISIDGGQDYFKCSAKNWGNFLRVDDENFEHPVRSVDSEDQVDNKLVEKEEMPQEPMGSGQILDLIIKQYEDLPQHAMFQPATNSDVLSVLYVFRSLFWPRTQSDR